jgi:hypothetical protein
VDVNLAQRYSGIVTFEKPGMYWMTSQIVDVGPLNFTASAIIKVRASQGGQEDSGDLSSSPPPIPPIGRDFDHTSLRGAHPLPTSARGPANHVITVDPASVVNNGIVECASTLTYSALSIQHRK